MMRWTVNIFLVTLLLLLIVMTLSMTPIGTRLSVALIGKMIPGTLHYRKVSGILIGPLTLTHVQYRYKDTTIFIKKLRVRWKPSQLWRGQWEIHRLTVDDVSVITPSQHRSLLRTPVAIPHLPLHWKIDNALLNHVNIHWTSGHSLQMTHLYLHAILTHQYIDIRFNAPIIKPYAVNVRFNAQGIPQDYQFRLQLDSREGRWVWNGQGGSQWLRMTTQHAHLLGGSLDAQMQLHFAPDWRWKIHAAVKQVNPSMINPYWPKQFNMTFITEGHITNQEPFFTLDATLQTPTAFLRAQGQHDAQRWDLQWHIAIVQLSSLLSESRGTLQGAGKIQGPARRPQSSGYLRGKDLSWFGYQIGQLHSQWDVDFSTQQASHVFLKAEQLEAPRWHLSALQIEAQGQPKTHQVSALAILQTDRHSSSRLDLLLEGQWMNALWRGHLTRADITSTVFGNWRLEKSVDMTISHTAVITAPLCWRSQTGQACWNGTWYAHQPWQMTFKATAVNVTPWLDLFKVPLQVNALATLNVNVARDRRGKKSGTASIQWNPGELRYITAKKTIRLPLSRGEFNARLDTQGLQARLQFQSTKNNFLRAELLLPHYSWGDEITNSVLKGSLEARLDQLALLHTFIPEIARPRGELSAHLTLSGTVKKPIAHGKINLAQGRIRIPQWHLILTHVTMDLNWQGLTANYEIKAYSQKQTLHAMGKTQFDQPGIPTSLSLTGTEVLIMDTPEYIVYASPQLTFLIKDKQIDIQGDIGIPKASLTPSHLSEAVSLPDDIVFEGKAAEKLSPWKMTLHLNLSVGNQVKVDAFGLSGQLTGKLLLTKTPTQGYLASGKLNLVKATYTAVGTTFLIAPSSSINFVNSPLNNPNLDIRVSRQVKTVPSSSAISAMQTLTVGLDILGTLRHPNISLFSTPPILTQADILSYLILGHPANANTPTNISLLLKAMDSLNLTSKKTTSKGIVDQITQGLGFSEFGIESEETGLGPIDISAGKQQSAFVVGRYISPKIYVRYGRTLSSPLDVVQVRYLLGTHWTIQSESTSLGNGADILYTIQSN
ncbi:MAG: hypothetical protein A3F41_05250 [Coxiella sp. RIFCSPHIGHO2_12_FULL_44_14]|nr:MAG: hypothetical protein A3F41_05250 [Coxiella sp. RIFCSPHIGHO2_12_FULL_44_14]